MMSHVQLSSARWSVQLSSWLLTQRLFGPGREDYSDCQPGALNTNGAPN